jgi:hypothetical protein
MQLKSLLFSILAAALITGCGGGDPVSSGSAVSKLAASSTCLNCHASAVALTGALITEEWRNSTHNQHNGAGCADCHEPAADHPNLCSTCHGGGEFQVTINPDATGKCLKCHGPAFPGDVMMRLAPRHYGYSTARALPEDIRASYVSGQYQGRCRACHNPHLNTLTQQHRDYAGSRHGDPKGVAWASLDFKTTASCIRCHTSTGYIAYVTSNFSVPSTGFGTGNTSREMLACDACHTSYDFKNSIRKVPAYTAPYLGYNAQPASFPDVAASNLCIPCHTGRESGQAVTALADDKLSTTRIVEPHFLSAAGLMYMQNGFTNFTSPAASIGTSTYGKSLSPDSASTPGGLTGGTSSTHRKLGTVAINADRHKPAFFLPGVLDKNGPCVTCHLNASGVPARPGSGHGLKIDANAFQQVCVNCHTTENTVALTSFSDFTSAFLNPQRESFEAALKLMQVILLQNYQISFSVDNPNFFFDLSLPLVLGNKQEVKDWTRGGRVNARKLMGACYNLSLLTRDRGAYVHARAYSRRLVYDSIDFLDDGIINLSVGQSAQAQSLLGSSLADNPVFGIFTKGAKAYDSVASGSSFIISVPAVGTSEAMLYLIGWSRSGTTAAAAGAWSASERP